MSLVFRERLRDSPVMSAYHLSETNDFFRIDVPSTDTRDLIEFLRPKIDGGFDVHIGIFTNKADGEDAPDEEDIFEFEKPADPSASTFSADELRAIIDKFRNGRGASVVGGSPK